MQSDGGLGKTLNHPHKCLYLTCFIIHSSCQPFLWLPCDFIWPSWWCGGLCIDKFRVRPGSYACDWF
jgi:hypothetical protein